MRVAAVSGGEGGECTISPVTCASSAPNSFGATAKVHHTSGGGMGVEPGGLIAVEPGGLIAVEPGGHGYSHSPSQRDGVEPEGQGCSHSPSQRDRVEPEGLIAVEPGDRGRARGSGLQPQSITRAVRGWGQSQWA